MDHHQIIVKLNNILCQHEDSEDTAKKSHTLHWEERSSGNSANAAVVKEAASVRVSHCTYMEVIFLADGSVASSKTHRGL